ncbi:TPA: elongation factor Ts [Candidatus Saccharibacteria bacterium]|nr:elongation factor Ts [Candidatus Saccharibacteria bacterium]HIO87222.1 elongation factor Ts [Candidatus Saccharibacteria bacterium]
MASVEDIKRLKSLTGVGLTAAKKALEEADGDFDKALEAMRIKGIAKADKKSDREASAGMVHAYIHGGKIGVLVEVNCETDFVARTDDFKAFVNDVALHVAAAAPQFVSAEDISEDIIAKEKDLIAKELEEQGKPKEMLDKIAEGKLKKFASEISLLEQGFVKNPDMTVGEYLKETIAKLGENMVIRRFERIEMGVYN